MWLRRGRGGLETRPYKSVVDACALPYRGRTKRAFEREQPRQSTSYAVREWNSDWFVNDIEAPYVDTSDSSFLWVRPRSNARLVRPR